MSKEIILTISSALMQSHLEYRVHFWTPQFTEDKDLLESVQKRVMEMIKGLEHPPA